MALPAPMMAVVTTCVVLTGAPRPGVGPCDAALALIGAGLLALRRRRRL